MANETVCATHPENSLVEKHFPETSDVKWVCVPCGEVEPEVTMERLTAQGSMDTGKAPAAYDAKQKANNTDVKQRATTSEELIYAPSTKSLQSREAKEVLSLITRGVIESDTTISRERALALVQDVIQLKRQGVANGGMNIIKSKLYVNKNGLMSLAARYDKDFFAIDFVVADEITRTAHAVPEGHLAFVARYKVNAGMGKVRRKITHPDGTIEETEEERRIIEIKSEALGMANPHLQRGGAEKDYPATMAKIRATRAVIQNVISTLPIGEDDQSLFLDLITAGIEFSEEVDAKLAEAEKAKEKQQLKAPKEAEPDDNPESGNKELSEHNGTES